MSGKGSARRPTLVDQAQAEANWNRIFKKKEEVETFSFRAECLADLVGFLTVCMSERIVLKTQRSELDEYGELSVEITTPCNLEALRQALREVEDGRTMLQTLRQCPLASNSLERDYKID